MDNIEILLIEVLLKIKCNKGYWKPLLTPFLSLVKLLQRHTGSRSYTWNWDMQLNSNLYVFKRCFIVWMVDETSSAVLQQPTCFNCIRGFSKMRSWLPSFSNLARRHNSYSSLTWTWTSPVSFVSWFCTVFRLTRAINWFFSERDFHMPTFLK